MIERSDVEHLKELFITRKECSEQMKVNDDRISSIREDTVVIRTQLKITLAILSAIGVAVLGVAIKLMFGV